MGTSFSKGEGDVDPLVEEHGEDGAADGEHIDDAGEEESVFVYSVFGEVFFF